MNAATFDGAHPWRINQLKIWSVNNTSPFFVRVLMEIIDLILPYLSLNMPVAYQSCKR
jgi:hypothetical protein